MPQLNVTTAVQIVADPQNPKYVEVVTGDIVDYASTSAVSSVSKDGSFDPTGVSFSTGTTIRASIWIRSRGSSVVNISDAPVQRREAFLSLVAPSGGLFSTDTLVVADAVPYYVRFVPTKRTTVSSVGFTIVAAGGLGTDSYDIGLFERGEQLLSSTGSTVLIGDNAAETADLDEPVTLEPGVPYFVGFKFLPFQQYATLTTSLTGANNDLKFTAVTAGTGGNAVTVRYVDPGSNDQDIAVSVVGSAITVSLATGGAGAITTDANSVLANIVATPAAAALVSVTTAPANSGAGVVTAMAATHLASGGTTTTLEVPAAVYPDVAVTQAFGSSAEDVLQATGSQSRVPGVPDWTWSSAVVSAPLIYLYEA